jgi:GDP/UDP-N,N'-diacetylbacillosamine 2-epimerase (hydrolysing)
MTSPKRRIFFLTGARSDYDLMALVIHNLRDTYADTVEASAIACAAQVSPFHGMGVRQVEADGVAIAGYVESLLSADTWTARSMSFAQLTEGLTRLLSTNRPDVLVIAGDREEALAGAIVANFLRIHVAHLHGGDRTFAADIDEVLRPAISKLAHLHFPCSEAHRERLIKMGEEPDFIWACGAPALDRLRTTPDVGDAVLRDEFGIFADQPFFLLIHHPSPMVSCGAEDKEMAAVLEGVLALGYPVMCSYPNSDPGNVGIRVSIDRAKAANPNLRVYHNLPRDRFVSLYRRCAAIVGNSSSLVSESAYLHRAAILIGPRQDLRDRGENVLRVDFVPSEITAACRRALDDPDYRAVVARAVSPFGDGHSGPRVAKILATIDLAPELLLKTITY